MYFKICAARCCVPMVLYLCGSRWKRVAECVQIAKNPLGVEFKVHNVSMQQVLHISVIDTGVGT